MRCLDNVVKYPTRQPIYTKLATLRGVIKKTSTMYFKVQTKYSRSDNSMPAGCEAAASISGGKGEVKNSKLSGCSVRL